MSFKFFMNGVAPRRSSGELDFSLTLFPSDGARMGSLVLCDSDAERLLSPDALRDFRKAAAAYVAQLRASPALVTS